MRPQRPLLRWHGGKYRLATWIISNFPAHRVYVEPYGGAGSVLLAKPRAYCEVWNDLDDNVFNLFQVMRTNYRALEDALRLTPFSRRELEIACTDHPDPIEKARRLIIRSFMGHGSDSASDINRATGFRSNSNRSHTTPAHDWVNYERHMHQLADRIRGVILECRDAREVMDQHDAPETLHYLDPPYLERTRKRYGAYRFEMTDAEHKAMLDHANGLKGKVLISAYEDRLYDVELGERGWFKVTRAAVADGAQKRLEVLWLNPHSRA